MKQDEIEREWDLSANTQSRMKAIRFVNNGKVYNESVYDGIYNMINAQMNFHKKQRILEVGAGSCLLLERIAKNVKEIYGTDISEMQLKLSPKILNATLEKMPSDRLKFANEEFDGVVCYSVSQYFPDHNYAERVFSELFRVLNKGGRLYLGDLFNVDLMNVFYKEQYSFLVRFRMNQQIAKIEKMLRGRSPADSAYLFFSPAGLTNFFYALGATNVKALLIIEPLKPEAHRKFRFDIVVEK